MKIAYVTHTHSDFGGIEKVLAYKASYLVNHGYEIYIITSSSKDACPAFYFDPRINFAYIQSGLEKNKKSLSEYLKNVEEELLRIKPDITISVGELNSLHIYSIQDESIKLLEIHGSRLRRKYNLTWLDDLFFGHYITDCLIKVKSKIVRSYNKTIVLTDENRASWRHIDNMLVIPNPLFSIPKDATISTCENKRVIAVGRFTSSKGFDYLIKIWVIVHEKHPEWVLHLFGQGPRENDYKNLIAKYNLQDSFIINPPTKDLEKEYQRSSIYAMTSKHEGQPLALMEAMSHGLPVVSFACKCGPRDLILDGKDGYLTDLLDVKTFADRLSLLMENEELRKQMGAKARINIQRYSFDKIMRKWMDLFDELVSKKK